MSPIVSPRAVRRAVSRRGRSAGGEGGAEAVDGRRVVVDHTREGEHADHEADRNRAAEEQDQERIALA